MDAMAARARELAERRLIQRLAADQMAPSQLDAAETLAAAVTCALPFMGHVASRRLLSEALAGYRRARGEEA